MSAAMFALAAPSVARSVEVPVEGPARAMAHPAVVVLWATWCVSCRAELARLPALARAAAPLPILTLAIDPPARALARLRSTRMPTQNAFADARDPAMVLAAWGGEGAVLPLAVALDRDGKVCGLKHGLLGTDQLRDWAKTCSR